MNWTPSHRLVGIATLLFAACPTVELVLMMLSDSNRGNGDHLPVSIGMPPLSFFLLVAPALSSPWIAAGILLLRNSNAGSLLALVLTVPTFPLILVCVGVAIDGLRAGGQFKWMGAIACGPFALFGLMFCLTVWWFEFSYWRSLKMK